VLRIAGSMPIANEVDGIVRTNTENAEQSNLTEGWNLLGVQRRRCVDPTLAHLAQLRNLLPLRTCGLDEIDEAYLHLALAARPPVTS
jgi:hypothetical protein